MRPYPASGCEQATSPQAGEGQLELVVLTVDDFLPLPDAEPAESADPADPAESDELLELESLEEPVLDSEPVDDEPFAAADDDSLPAPTVLEPFRLSLR